MSRPNKPTCDGDCFHCQHDDCDSGTFAGGRRTPFEQEQSKIREEKKRAAREFERQRSAREREVSKKIQRVASEKHLEHAAVKIACTAPCRRSAVTGAARAGNRLTMREKRNPLAQTKRL